MGKNRNRPTLGLPGAKPESAAPAQVSETLTAARDISGPRIETPVDNWNSAEPPRRRQDGDVAESVVSSDAPRPFNEVTAEVLAQIKVEDTDAAISRTAAHFGITPDELRARVEAGPVEEVRDDDLGAALLAPAPLAEKPPRFDASALASAYVEAKKARLGPAALSLSVTTEIPYFETAVRKVLGEQ